MIWISKTPSGLLIQRDDTEIAIDTPAVASTLGIIIGELIDSGKAIQAARRAAYEDGLLQGRTNAAIEYATSERIAERQAADLVEALTGCELATAA